MSGTREITLSKGAVAIIDESDYDKVVNMGSWYLGSTGYAMCDKGGRHMRMHRTVVDAPYRLHVDHINGDRLDNRKINLRICTERFNAWHRTVPTAKKVYKDLPPNITFDISRKKYIARVSVFKRFDTLAEAELFVNNKLLESEKL